MFDFLKDSVGLGHHQRRIDVHHHLVPDFYAQWLTDNGLTAGGLPLPTWSAEASLEQMEKVGTAKAILSISTPGVHLGDDQEARRKAREVNEYAARVVADHAGRFGFFATLTLPDVEGALAELAYAFDELHADGVVLLANSRGIYLGDEQFEPLMAELNRRRAVVFVHPNDLPGPGVPGIPEFAADFLLDTTRAAIKLVSSGTMSRHNDLKIILSHAGGFLPYAAQRIVLGLRSPQDPPLESGIEALFDRHQFKKFYFDTALSASPYALPSLLAFADPGRILFGSDYPYAPRMTTQFFAANLDAYDLTHEQRTRINYGNAQALFGPLQTS